MSESSERSGKELEHDEDQRDRNLDDLSESGCQMHLDLVWVQCYNPWMFATPRTSLAYQVSGILYQLNKTRPAFCRNARCLQYHVCKHSGALSNTSTTPVCGAVHSRILRSSMLTFPLSASTISSPFQLNQRPEAWELSVLSVFRNQSSKANQHSTIQNFIQKLAFIESGGRDLP